MKNLSARPAVTATAGADAAHDARDRDLDPPQAQVLATEAHAAAAGSSPGSRNNHSRVKHTHPRVRPTLHFVVLQKFVELESVLKAILAQLLLFGKRPKHVLLEKEQVAGFNLGLVLLD